MITREVMVTEADGTKKVFPSVAKTAEYYGISSTAITNRIIGKVTSDSRKFEYTGNTFIGNRSKQRELKDEFDDTPGKMSKKEIAYETLGTRVCITPCECRKDIKVGSSKCQACSRFHRINREKHIVICG